MNNARPPPKSVMKNRNKLHAFFRNSIMMDENEAQIR